MNGIGVRINASPEVVEQQIARLVAFAKVMGACRIGVATSTQGWGPDSIHRRYPAAGLATAMATQLACVGGRFFTLAWSRATPISAEVTVLVDSFG
jgi:hypothetical protein